MASSVTLMLGDCLERMEEIPDGSVDMVLCDLPYGTTQNKWDSPLPLDGLWGEYARLCRGAIVLTAAQPFTSAIIQSLPQWFRYCLVWDKVSVTGHLNAKRRPLVQHEDIVVFCKRSPPYNPQGLEPFGKMSGGARTYSKNWGAVREKGATEFTGYPRSILRFPQEKSRHHPTQKPVALMEYMIRTCTNEGETVLDNTMGSGTTGVACVNTGRNFIGIERDEGYFAIAEKRIADAVAAREQVAA